MDKGYLLIRDLWTQGTDIIHNVCVMNTDAVSNKSKTPEKCLETAEPEKSRKCLNACLNERRHFTSFVALVDVIFGVEAEAMLKRISSLLAQKWKGPYSRTYGYVKSILANHSCTVQPPLHPGARFPASFISVPRPRW